MAIVPDESRAFLGKTGLAAQNLYISLYTNDQTVGVGAVVGSFTKSETNIGTGPAGNSNACGTLFSGSWGGANASGTYTATQVSYGGTYSWTYNATTGTIYGYAISTGTGMTGTLAGAERFATPQNITASGDKISVVVKLLTA